MNFAEEIRKTAVIGAGQMGHGIAQSFAQAGYPVMLHDITPERVEAAMDRIRQNLNMFVANDLTTASKAERAMARITGTTDLHAAVADADFIEEAVFENLAIKRELYGRLEGICQPETIIASNTSGMMPTDLAANMQRPERFVVAHFWKPPYLVRLVEVVAGKRTAPGLAAHVSSFLESVNKKPVIVRKEAPGYIGNRIQYAIIREAAHMVDEGIASAEDVDMAIVEGFGIRFSFAGIFKITDLTSQELVASICSYLLKDLGNETGVPKAVADKVEARELGAPTGKGFYDWSPESIAEIRKIWDEALIHQMKQRG